jgi:V/A-type H+-transporting ATPase subunit E
MNGVQNIIGRIEADSAAECAQIKALSEQRCAEIKAEYSQAEQDAYWKMINDGAKDAELRLERLDSMANLEAKKLVLATKQELVSQTFERAAQLLAELPEDKYVPFLVKLAASAAGAGGGHLVFSGADRERVGKRVCDGANAALTASGKPAGLTLSSETRDIRGGFVLVSGDVECNCSADALVSQHRNELSSKVAAALFE